MAEFKSLSSQEGSIYIDKCINRSEAIAKQIYDEMDAEDQAELQQELADADAEEEDTEPIEMVKLDANTIVHGTTV